MHIQWKGMRALHGCILVLLVTFFSFAQPALAFCGFYVAKADASLYNKASKVIFARDRDRTILTMANDFQGSVKDFAIVVPVPVPIRKEQVRVTDPAIIERLDAFSAPRLVEYFDENPCEQNFNYRREQGAIQSAPVAAPRLQLDKKSLGVTVEAKFSVGEYDILILGAKESNGLATWLQQNGYKMPKGAATVLQPYIRQNMKFFVAKVNLNEFQKSGFQFLRPLQIAYQSPKFMLPIRLGMLNASGEQDLIVFVLSPKGRAEVTNYLTVEIPSNAEIPLHVKPKFADFYKAMFKTSYNQQGQKAAFLEYAWDMSSCDPCSANPLTPDELKKAGVFWLNTPSSSTSNNTFRRPAPVSNRVFITRLHVRYTRAKFPEDLMFQETNNQNQFQGRYVLRHPVTGNLNCEAGRAYQRSLVQRAQIQTQTLAKLTGWNVDDIRRQSKPNIPVADDKPFWNNIWK
jgi:hypothetical protein